MLLEGKAGARFMEGTVFSHLGARGRRVSVGPGRGLDNAVLSIGLGRALILTVDPISILPEFGMRLSAWLSVHLIASDYTSSGCDPEFATFTYNFPRSTHAAGREEYIRSIGSECKKLGVSIVGGNTGSYPGAAYTVVGTGSMLGTAAAGKYVTPSMARAGDVVLVTKHAAIEATGSLAISFTDFVEAKLGRAVASRARNTIRFCSTVEDARAARRVGLGRDAVTAMHDATEGGILGALDEMAYASRHAFEVDPSTIPVPDEVAKVCSLFGLDPLRTMGEGALLITCHPGQVDELRRKVTKAGYPLTEIGRVKEGEGLWLSRPGSRNLKFSPVPDRYWAAYAKGTRRRHII